MQNASLFAQAASLLSVLLVGCATNVEKIGPNIELPNHGSTTEINSEIVGTLNFEGKCLLFERRNSSGTYLPLWPIGTRFDGKTVILPMADGGNGASAVVGRQVQLLGTNEIPSGDQPDPKCRGLRFSVVQLAQ